MKWNLDLGDNTTNEIPLDGRKSISFLLGAGFSAPMGYPIGNDMNESLLDFDEADLTARIRKLHKHIYTLLPADYEDRVLYDLY